MIEQMIEMGKEMANVNPTETPNYKVLAMIADQFRNRCLPVKYVGRIELDVNEGFFEDQGEAEEFIENMCICVEKLYHAIEEEFGEEDTDKIFGDMVGTFSITYNY